MYLSTNLFSVVGRSGKAWAGLLAVLTIASVCSAQAGLLSEDARRDTELRPGVVYIVVRATGSLHDLPIGDRPMSGPCRKPASASGSGFLYRPDGYLITNGHVAQLAYSKDQQAVEEQKKFVFQKCFQDAVEARIGRHLSSDEVRLASRYVSVDGAALIVVLDNGKQYEGEVKAYSDPITSPNGKDVAVIKIDANNLPTVPLGDSGAINVNDKIYAIGYPGAADISKVSELVATTSEGIISALKAKDYSSTPLLQTTANINHGSSGGPAFDGSGKAIGITTLGTEPGFNFLVPINTAMEFVHAAGAAPQRGTFDETWHNALDAYAKQDWTRAHDLLTEALEMFPNQPDARRLQAQAAANIPFESPFIRIKDVLGIPGIIFVCVAIVVIAGLLLWLLVRKPPQVQVQSYKGSFKGSSAAAPISSGTILPATKIKEAGPRSALSSAAEESYGSLIISGGPLTGNRFQVPKAGLTIGRDPSKNSVVLPDDSISKEHAWVVPVDNGVAIIDRDSANGTYINSVDSPRINKVVLRHGDRVYLGKTNQSVFTYYSS